MIDVKKIQTETIEEESFQWGEALIDTIFEGGLYGIPQNLSLFRFHHADKELHYLNGPLDDTFYGVAAIITALGYTVYDFRGGEPC
jgi:hypothetical protein